jgi:hypothetical protein
VEVEGPTRVLSAPLKPPLRASSLCVCRTAKSSTVRSDATPKLQKTGFSVPSGWVDGGSVCHRYPAMASRSSAAMLLLSALVQHSRRSRTTS